MIIQLSTGSKIKMKPNSQFVLSSHSLSSGTTIKLKRGGIFSQVSKLKSGQKYNISTGSTVAGVRGTMFYMHSLSDKQAWLCVNEGEVEVNEQLSNSQVVVKEGLGIQIQANQDIEQPKVYGWTKKLNWNMDATQGEVEDDINLSKIYDILDADYD